MTSESRTSSLTTSRATMGWLRHELRGCGRGSRKQRRLVDTHGHHNIVEIRLLSPTLGQTFRPTAGRTRMVPRLWIPNLQIQFQHCRRHRVNVFTKTAVSDTTDLGSMLLPLTLTDTNSHFSRALAQGDCNCPPLRLLATVNRQSRSKWT